MERWKLGDLFPLYGVLVFVFFLGEATIETIEEGLHGFEMWVFVTGELSVQDCDGVRMMMERGSNR